VNIHFVDAGVEPEVAVLREAYGNRVRVIHIKRQDFDFVDSRHYLSAPDGVIHNVDGQVDRAVDEVLLYINRWLEELDDKIDAGVTAGVLAEGS